MSQPWDETIYKSVAIKRSQFFKPLAIVLAKAGFTPDLLSYLGLVSMLIFAFTVGHHPVLGLWLLIVVLLLDQLDGALARYQKTDSDRGKFVDVAIDSTTFSLFVAGLIGAGLVSGLAGGIYIYLAFLSRVLIIIRNNINRKSDWLFYSGAGALPSSFLYASYGFFGLSVLTNLNYLQLSTVVFASLLALKAISDYRDIKAR